ncbi:MAG: MarR family winged helix-turn-helix transcriptional regulator [Pseudonocardiaceae bacterium]
MVVTGRWAVVQYMVTTEDARWLAGYLRKMVSSRPAAWACTELTLSQLIALHIISAAKAPMTLISLSEALGTRPPATCAMVNRLARAGLVRRAPDPDDLRRVLLFVTSQSAQLIGKIDPDTAKHLQAVLTSMGSAAQRVLTEVLKDTARRLAR